MRDGPREFRQDSSCPALLRIPLFLDVLTSTGLSPSTVYLSRYFLFVAVSFCGPMTPALPQQNRFGLFPFRSPLLWESIFLSLPPGTKMFQFPGFARILRDSSSSYRVSPFGHPRINSCLPIPAAFRSLPRPSSPIEAKASSVRSFFLRLESCFRSK